MKGIVNSLLLGLVLMPALESKAELLDEDDAYIGFQLSIPIEQTGNHLAAADIEYSFLLIDKTDGITTGLTWIQDTRRDTDTLAYLPPSNGFNVGKSRISAHAVPLLTNDDTVNLSVSHVTTFDGMDFLMYTIAGIYVLGRVIDDVFDSFDEIDDDTEEPDEED